MVTSAYVVSVARDIAHGSRHSLTAKCPRRLPSLLCANSQWCGRRLPLTVTVTGLPYSTAGTIRCDGAEQVLSQAPVTSAPGDAWINNLMPGSVIEVWSQGELRFGLVSSMYEKGAVVSFVDVSSGTKAMGIDEKVSFGEIIGVWDKPLQPPGQTAAEQLVADVEAGLRLLKNSLPRSLDLGSAYQEMGQVPKNDPKRIRSSAEVARWVFPMQTTGGRDRNAAITVATAILLASDRIRFKRAGAGRGWRALPASVAVARGRCSFVDRCKRILEQRASGSIRQKPMWSREHLEILRELEIYAASGSGAKGTAATALEALGYEPTDDGAARMLLDIEYWATGTVENHGGSASQYDTEQAASTMSSWIDPRYAEFSDQEKASANSRKFKIERFLPNGNGKAQSIRDWTFPPEILADARELRASAREKRVALLESQSTVENTGRRNIGNPLGQKPLRVYCIDDRGSRFLDDALSVQVLEDSSVVRMCVHVADVDEVVRSGSTMDDLARERGQSLYLPLKPLHMLPAAAMDAASFSSSFPTEAISILVDFDLKNNVIRNWEVFASVVPPVMRLNYDQFDAALEGNSAMAQISEEDCENLRRIAKTASLLAERLDQRRVRRRQKSRGGGLDSRVDVDDNEQESKGIASVRLVKKGDKGSGKAMKVARVVDFRTTGSHVAVGEMLTSAGALIRQFAKENRVHLPEDRGASWYVARCGTAPLRRYADLAIQRQIKCVLFGRQPAGRRRMDELRLWLARRQSAGERTVAERRKSALYDSFSNHCSQQCLAAGSKHAVVRGQVCTVNVTKAGVLKVGIKLDGTGLDAVATVSPSLNARILAGNAPNKFGTFGEDSRSPHVTNEAADTRAMVLAKAKDLMRPRSKIRVQIDNVDPGTRRIQATVMDVL